MTNTKNIYNGEGKELLLLAHYTTYVQLYGKYTSINIVVNNEPFCPTSLEKHHLVRADFVPNIITVVYMMNNENIRIRYNYIVMKQ